MQHSKRKLMYYVIYLLDNIAVQSIRCDKLLTVVECSVCLLVTSMSCAKMGRGTFGDHTWVRAKRPIVNTLDLIC